MKLDGFSWELDSLPKITQLDGTVFSNPVVVNGKEKQGIVEKNRKLQRGVSPNPIWLV